MSAPTNAPFPYSGGKAPIAAAVWQALGDCYSYLEPFCGSAAVLLGRPQWHTGRREVIGDLNGYVANAWRAIQLAPEQTARHCWWPSIHADLTARHKWLVNWGRNGGLARLMDDPDYYDCKVAGWWIWGVSNWIAVSEFCSAAFAPGGDPANTGIQQIYPIEGGRGVMAPRKGGGGLGMGYWAGGRGVQNPRISDAPGNQVADGVPAMCYWQGGVGVQPARITDAPTGGMGILWKRGGGGTRAGRITDSPATLGSNIQQLPPWGGRGVQPSRVNAPFDASLADDHLAEQERWIPWFIWLSQRLAKCYILNRPWESVCQSRSVAGDFEGHSIGVFLDPPYRNAKRNDNLYAVDDNGGGRWKCGNGRGRPATFPTGALRCAAWTAITRTFPTAGVFTAGATPGGLAEGAPRTSRARWCCSVLTA